MAYNKVVLEGRLVSDVELKTTQSGIEYCNFTMAVDRPFKNGEERLADFPTLKSWRGTAKFISHYFHKGDPIIVDGRLETSTFTDSDGKKVYRTDVVVENATFTISKKSGEIDTSKPLSVGQKNADLESFTEISDDDKDLPF